MPNFKKFTWFCTSIILLKTSNFLDKFLIQKPFPFINKGKKTIWTLVIIVTLRSQGGSSGNTLWGSPTWELQVQSRPEHAGHMSAHDPELAEGDQSKYQDPVGGSDCLSQ